MPNGEDPRNMRFGWRSILPARFVRPPDSGGVVDTSGTGSRRVSRAAAVRIMALALAVVLPVAIVVGSLAGLERFRTFADEREARNAGKVINGRVAEGGVIRVIENKLEMGDPDVVILGNSLSNTDIQPPLLARRLGVAKTRVQKFSIPNSMGAHWYAILKNRVYANGHQPKVVVILSDLQSLLALTPRSEASHLNLSVQLGERELVIDQLLGTRYYYLERVRENRGKLRENFLTAARNSMVDLLVNHTLVPTDERQIENALARVFDSSHTDMRLHNTVIPIFNTDSESTLVAFDPSELPDPQDSFLPRIAQLVQQNNGRLVFLRPPMSPLLPEGIGDLVLPETEAKVRPLMEEYGGVYLDLRTVPMDVNHFHNVDHMNGEGARRFTEIVAELFDDLELTGPRRPASNLLKSVGIAEGTYVPLPIDVSFKSELPPVPRPDRPYTKGRGKLMFFQTEGLSAFNDLATIEVTPHASRCSPLRVVEDGVPLPGPNTSCDMVTRYGMGRTCHTPDKVFFTAIDNSNPYLSETPSTYGLALDPERSCDAALWLYPYDRARVDARPYDLAVTNRGAGVLIVAGRDFGAIADEDQTEPTVTLRVRAGNQVRAEAVLPTSALAGRGTRLKLEPRIAATAQAVSVEITNDSGHYVLLTTLRLADGGRP